MTKPKDFLKEHERRMEEILNPRQLDKEPLEQLKNVVQKKIREWRAGERTGGNG